MASDSIQVFATGTIITLGGSSVAVAIPATSAGGTPPKYVRLAATQPCYVKLGTTPTAVAGDLLVQPADSVVVSVARCAQIAALQAGTGGILQISPLEDQ